jgi:hypothetical protein
MSGFAWWNLGDCRGVSSDIFFEEDEVNRAKAEALCAGCGCRVACRDEALAKSAELMAEGDGHLDFGFQGGLSVEARQRMVVELSCYSETHTQQETS